MIIVINRFLEDRKNCIMEKGAFIYEVISSVLKKSSQLIKYFQITHSLCFISLMHTHTYSHMLKEITVKHTSILLAWLTFQHGI